jgi:recombination protein RecT
MTTQIATIGSICNSPAILKRFNEIMGKRTPQFISSLISITNDSPQLKKADPNTVIAAAMIAATLDLPINKNLGFAWIVPYKGKAQFQIGYKGLIQLAQRSGQFKKLNDAVIPNGAMVSFDPITGDYEVDFSKGDESKDPDGYLVYMELVNGFVKTVYWTRARVEAHAKRFSQAYSSAYDTPWKSDFDAMALKTVLKYTLNKYAPLSVDMQKAVTADQSVIDIDGEVISYPDNETETPKAEDVLKVAEEGGEKS